LTVAGIDPIADPRVRVYELASGRFLSSQSRSFEIVLTRKIADQHSIGLNDPVELIIGREPQTFNVIGLLANKGAANMSNGAVGLSRTTGARGVGREQGDQVDLVAEPSIAQDPNRPETATTLQDQLGETFAVSYPAAGGQSTSSAMNSISTGLVAFSTIALLVGAILTYNTFSMIALERTREWGLLRSLGAGRAQLRQLPEAPLLAPIGSTAGLVGGVALALPPWDSQGCLRATCLSKRPVLSSGLIAAAPRV
jgi:putative ABC transport system permease protein